MKQIMGVYLEMLQDVMAHQQYPLSFLSDAYNDVDVDVWREEARARVRAMLSYHPPETPLDTQVHNTYVKDGLLYQHISYAQPYGPRTEGILLSPEHAEGKLPGVVALHDHGGFKFFGKEKITAPRNMHPILHEFQQHYYGGRAWAAELAARGYVVFVPDAFLWGSRKLRITDIPEWYTDLTAFTQPEDSDAYIVAYNALAGYMESDIAKSLTEAGITWPGIMLYDDSRAVDFLLTQPNVDADNIGCGGLSGGGLRTVFLAGLDERVKCSVCVGFMATSEDFACYKAQAHTWMMYLPGLTNLMDFTDLYALRGRKPTMALYDAEDQLFTPKGMADADRRLAALYAKMGTPELYSGAFFPGPHKFDVAMQEAAFDFYDRWLK